MRRGPWAGGHVLIALAFLLLAPAAAGAAEASEAEAVRAANRDAKVGEQRQENGGLSHTAVEGRGQLGGRLFRWR